MRDLTFAYPLFFYLFLLWAAVIAWYIRHHRRQYAAIQMSSLKGVEPVRTLRERLRHLPFALRMLTLALIICILARPQSSNNWTSETTEGIDIMLAVDISSSMLAQDFKPDRLEAAKEVAVSFISGRETDRMGLVVFSGESFTQCPLTTDRTVLINLLRDIHSGMIEDGTAVGSGLATAVNRIKDSDAKSKVIILLTDGVNNRGSVAPMTAAEIARTFGIRVYTIGVGSEGMAPYPVQTPYGVQMQRLKTEIDEQLLTDIAAQTGGKYFRATDNEKLRAIYEEIDQMERSVIHTEEHHKKQEEFFRFALLACCCLILEILLRYTFLKTLP
ncbi:MAG: VWA domain-containing protein [Bacteroidales bacterium]|nr:VWA domain-containing protein [Bacteroidales bacterium]